MRFQVGYPTLTLAPIVSQRTLSRRASMAIAAAASGVVHAQRSRIVHAQQAFLGQGAAAAPAPRSGRRRISSRMELRRE
jgi:hypothetical protein